MVVWVGLAIGVLLATVVSNVITERIEGLKHLQEIHGVNKLAYWVANFLVDYFVFMCLMTTMIFSFIFADAGIHA